jgi:exonuclease SbcC
MPYWTVETVGQPEDVTNLAGKMQQLQSDVFTASNLKNEALKQKSEANQGLEMFFAENKDLTQEAVMSLNRHTAAEIMRLRDNLNRQKNTLEQKKTLLDNICRQTQEHQNNKPDFAEDENPAVISERLRLNEQQAAELSEKKGAVNQLLNADAEAKKKLQSSIEDANKKRQVYEQWAMLNTLIGDKEGTKFRKIAQGYILSNLVSAANIYMQRLTNRYTLHTLAGTFIIMVTDAYQGYVARPVSTISGGESFLVSLALALALSDIGQNLRVETLFIDEGFGTLSGEPLQRAIETLQSLHKHAGRQVGIISHIEEVRERIPVQIRVHRDGNNSAGTVEIVADGV